MTDLPEDEDTDVEENLKNKYFICDVYRKNNMLWYRCAVCPLGSR